MDRMPAPAGGAPDGAFERFLTAAIATIITIMFSWRLLAEEEEASGATGSTSGLEKPYQFSGGSSNYIRPGSKSPPRQNSSAATRAIIQDDDIDFSLDENRPHHARSQGDSSESNEIVHEDIVYDRHEPVQSRPLETSPVADDSISSLKTDDSLTADTLTTWDEYKWEEEMGEEEPCVIKTRRNVRDFLSPNKSVNLSPGQNEPEYHRTHTFGPSSLAESGLNNSVPFSQRFANFEYKDTGGDSGYIDLYPDVESDDDTSSSDDEHVYEIQVSDSDSGSESESEKGGAFYGVTPLDTIMEEYESDVSDRGEGEYDVIAREKEKREREAENEINSAFEDERQILLDKVCDINEASNSLTRQDLILQNVTNDRSENDRVTEVEKLQQKAKVNALCQFQPNQDPLRSSEVNSFEHNLSHEVTDTLASHGEHSFSVSPNVKVCDLNINQSDTKNSNLTQNNVDIGSTDENQVLKRSTKENVFQKENSVKAQQNSDTVERIMKLNLSGDEYKISEISDDSLPPSPVRTCALDNLNEEPFSDTESCGSGSVITVISVKSNDSENYADRFENSRNPKSYTQTVNNDPASGRRDLSTLINDQNTDGKYENFSLVSGFLNDSLNSLLSTNTGSVENSDTESSSEKENTEKESELQSAHAVMNGKLASDESSVSSAESLPAVGEVIQTNAQITQNGHIDSQDSLNTSSNPNLNEVIGEELNQPAQEEYPEFDDSDPPLREYDPHEDDLAAYQFNFDSDDDDSFFLVSFGDRRNDDSDDEGKLRNFETFTNLNSVGLSPDYSDAVTSRTFSDDARSFKFSYTEDVSTDFKKRSYFTERPNLSDSDTPLSPTASQSSDVMLLEIAEQAEPEISDHPERQDKLRPSSATYADAELSDTRSAIESESKTAPASDKIDFKKYIINSDLSPIAEHVSFPEEEDFTPIDKDISGINNNNLVHNNDQISVINNRGDKMNTYSETDLNNLQPLDGHEETFSSLTEKIERLTHRNDEELNTSDSQKAAADSRNGADLNYTGTVKQLNEEIGGNSISAAKTQKHPKETLIDEVVRNSDKNIEGATTKKVETDVDIIDVETVTKASGSPRTQSRVETNIDDVLNDVTSTVQRERSTAQQRKIYATPTKSKIETNIDDLFEEDFVADTSTTVHSTPFKHTWRQSRETNIDDIFEENRTNELHLKIDSHEESPHSDSSNEDESVAKETTLDETNVTLSYETFVDDLFDGVVPRNSSQLQTAGQFLTSESAIVDRENKVTVLSEVDNKQCEVKLKSVQPLNDPESINTKINNKRSVELNGSTEKIDEAVPSNKIHVGQINNRDKDVDSDKIGLDLKQYEDKTVPSRHEIGPNYRKNSEDHENSGISKQEPEYLEDNNLLKRRNIGHTDRLKESEICNYETERNVNNLLPKNVDTDNTQQLQSNLNNRELEFKDHNANIALPKSEEFVSSGRTPGDDSRYVYERFDIPVQIKFSSSAEHNIEKNIDNVSHSGLQIDDGLLKSEEECDVSDVELKIVEDVDNVKLRRNVIEDEQLDSIGSCSLASDDESLQSFEECYHSLQDSYNLTRSRGQSESAAGRIIRTPATKPSDIFGKQKELKGVKRKIQKHHLKKYTSVLQSPVTPERVNIVFESPHRPPSVARLKVLKSRERFLSAENLIAGSFEDKFLQHRTSFTSTPRKYLKRHERHLQSTESLPSDMLAWNTSYGSNLSVDGMHSLPLPRQIEELYGSRYSSTNTSFEKADIHKLHANCMFSPEKREEIRHTTKSLENMFEQLLRYGSLSSLATEETDIDADESTDVSTHAQYLQDAYLSFQYPLERAASMSAISGPSESHKLPRKHGKGRFASRHVPKSKSLQTLETNLDDVFANETDQPGKLTRTPSEHELRVSKSLSKLNVPDWFRKSSFSRSDSTQSLFTYAGRLGSTSTIGSSAYPPSVTTSPSPSVTPGSNTVIIQKRVTPSSTSPTAKLVRAPMLPTTPERAPIHNTSLSLPSDKYRKDKQDKLKPIPIIPFAKLREMFEKKSQANVRTVSPVTSPTKEKPKVRFEGEIEATVNDISSEKKPVQNERTVSPPPPIPERKPIQPDVVNTSENAPQSRKVQQVHFSDENHVSTRSQEQNVKPVSQNGTKSGTSSKPAKKPQGLRASLPMPQFRFRRPGSYAKQAALAANQSSSSQNKKGKNDSYYGDSEVTNEIAQNFPQWLHALEHKTKTDGETLFEFLQKRRYSGILENGFAEQLEELQGKNVTFSFPVMALSRHSSANGDLPLDGSPDLQVILTNAHAHSVSNGYLQNKLRSDVTVDDILDGLLLLDGHRTGRMRLDENGRIVPRTFDSLVPSPDTPPGMYFKINSREYVPRVNGDIHYDENDGVNTDYLLVKCENPVCKKETNLKEAKHMYKSCHSCFTYYCSRDCRKLHWETHKQVCVYSKVNSACKHVIKYINRQHHLQYQCSRIARRGYLSQGRGCVVFAFPDISSSEDFLNDGMDSLWVPPVYISVKELPHATMLGSKLGILIDTCKQYNPELKYVIHVAIVIPPKLPPHPVPRRMEAIIQKCAKLRLSPAHMHPKQECTDIPTTLILTAVPGNQHSDDTDGRKTRELCFVNIQRKLRHRGVSLRHEFADVYNRLIDFVSDAKHFSPLIIYPVDKRTGKKFMCVIMPEAEPEIEWIRDPDLFHELDIFDDETTELSTPNVSVLQQPEIML